MWGSAFYPRNLSPGTPLNCGYRMVCRPQSKQTTSTLHHNSKKDCENLVQNAGFDPIRIILDPFFLKGRIQIQNLNQRNRNDPIKVSIKK